MYGVFVGIQLLGILLAFVAIALIMHMDGSNAQKMMVCFMIGVLVQNAANLFEAMAMEPAEAVVAIKLQYLGACFVPFFFSQFIFLYCNKPQPKWIFSLLGVIDLCILASVWGCDRYPFFYKKMEFVQGDGHPHFVFEYGWGFWLFLIFGAFIPFGLVVQVLIRTIRQDAYQRRKRRYISFIALCVIPAGALLLRAAQGMKEYDLVPPTLSIVLSSVVILVWSRRNYDLSKAAAEIVLHEIQDGVLFLDDEQRIMSYNPAMETIFPDLDKHILGKKVTGIRHFPEEIMVSDGHPEFDLGERHFEGHIEPVNDKNGTLLGYIILIFDITQTKRLVMESIEMRQKAEAASRAKSEFMATMSHEMRTPMNAIVGFAELIKEESLGRKVYQYACDIKSASGRLLDIFNDIWDISTVEAGRMQLVQKDYETTKLLQAVAEKAGAAAEEKGLEFQQNISGDLPAALNGDEGRIRQVLSNILDNAVKYTNEGSVSLSVETEGPVGEWVTVKFVIKDTGIGIEKENLQKIFYNFEQVDSSESRSVEGIGLGLSVAKNLTELMGGKLEVESILGTGSTFTVRIPQKVADDRKISLSDASLPGSKREIMMFSAPESRILVVDDNLINRKIAKGMLRNYGCQVDEAESGPEAIALVNAQKYDIIFMDHMMPEMDGMETAQIIRKECGLNGRDAVIVALTANVVGGIEKQFLENGFQDFVAKPMDRIPLHRVMSKWIPEAKKRKLEKQVVDTDIDLEEIEGIFIRGIDIKKVMEKHAGNLGEYLEILNLFYMDGLRKSQYLQELKEEKDYKNYRIEVHALKGAAGNIGAEELAGEAELLENAAAEENDSFLEEYHDELLEHYNALLQEIRQILDKRRQREERNVKGVPRKPASKEEITDSLKEALNALEHFKSRDCREKVEWLLEHGLEETLRRKLLEIQRRLQLYEDDEAEELLRQILLDEAADTVSE